MHRKMWRNLCDAKICYDSASQEGIQFNPSASDLTNNDYYVLIHADDENKHHLAKITEVLAMDSTGDGFEFTPKLGNELGKLIVDNKL